MSIFQDEFFDDDIEININDKQEHKNLNVNLMDLLEILPSRAKELAKRYIDIFFANKDMHCGGKILQNVLFSEKYINMVVSYDVCNGVDKIYSTMNEEEINELDDDNISSQTEFVIMALHECHKLKIPKQFIGGIIYMYLELCHGIKQEEECMANIWEDVEINEF